MHICKGDVVSIILPASGCTCDEYDAALDFVRRFGLVPQAREYDSVVRSGLCANSAEYRFGHLIEALESKDSKAVWCLKGGYGSQQLLTRLDELKIPPEEKMFIGFSDITILLNYFADKWGWKCLHGPMPGQVGKVFDSTWQNLADVVFGDRKKVSFLSQPLNKAARLEGWLEGKFMGGCLSLMQALIGTAHMPDLDGAVLLLEDDRFETPRRIDRILEQMQRAGVFYKVRAVVLGNFLENPDVGSNDKLELGEVLEGLADYLDYLRVPLIQNTKLGHAQEMLTIPIGGLAKIRLGDKPEVIIEGLGT